MSSRKLLRNTSYVLITTFIPLLLLFIFFRIESSDQMGSFAIIGLIGLYLFLQIYFLWWILFSILSLLFTFIAIKKKRPLPKHNFILIALLSAALAWYASLYNLIPAHIWVFLNSFTSFFSEKF